MRSCRLAIARLDGGEPQNKRRATITSVQHMVGMYTLQASDGQVATLTTVGGETIQVTIAGNPPEVTVYHICALENDVSGYGLLSEFNGKTKLFLGSDCLPGMSLIFEHVHSEDDQLRPQFQGVIL